MFADIEKTWNSPENITKDACPHWCLNGVVN